MMKQSKGIKHYPLALAQLNLNENLTCSLQETVALSETVYGKTSTNTAVFVMYLAEAIFERDGFSPFVEVLCDRALSISVSSLLRFLELDEILPDKRFCPLAQENIYGKHHEYVLQTRRQADCWRAKACLSENEKEASECCAELNPDLSISNISQDFMLDAATSLRRFASFCMTQNLYDRALMKAEEALTILQSYPEKHVEFARIYRTIGDALFAQGRLQDSLSKYTTSLAFALNGSHEGRLEELNINLSIGRVMKEMGNCNEALTSLDYAMKMQMDELGLRSLEVANTLDEMSTVLAKMYRFDEALNHVNRAIYIKSLHFSTQQNTSYASSMDAMGLIHRLQGKHHEALGNYTRSLEIREEVRTKLLNPCIETDQWGSGHAFDNYGSIPGAWVAEFGNGNVEEEPWSDGYLDGKSF